MMELLPIIVIAYNRPDSLHRLLHSIERAQLPEKGIDLYVSIDHSDDPACAQLAEQLDWKHGKKTVIQHDHQLGLLKHVMACGDLAAELGAAIILEDDLTVSPAFHDYACRATAFYKDQQNIAGISLYSYAYTETRNLPFEALHTEHDTYFMQVASSWGQVWTSQHWKGFRSWIAQHPQISAEENIPDHLREWGAQSWKKQFNRYLIDSSNYFVHPMVSFTTNFEDPGTHATTRGLYQVSLAQSAWDYSFDELSSSKNRFDAWFEMEADSLKTWNPSLSKHRFAVDLYGSKNLQLIEEPEVLTSRNAKHAYKAWNDQLFPRALNIVSDQPGQCIRLCAKEDVTISPAPPREWFFRTRSLVPDYILERQVFHVLIPALEGPSADLEQTLVSIEKQDYDLKRITVLVPAQHAQALSHIDTRATVMVCLGTSEADLLREGFRHLQHGMTVALAPGDCLAEGALKSAAEIFSTFSDIRWIIGAPQDDRGFIPFDFRLNAHGLSNARQKQALPFGFTASFLRVEWIQHAKMQEAMAGNSSLEWLAMVSQESLPNLAAQQLVAEKPNKRPSQQKSVSHNIKAGVDSVVNQFCRMAGKRTNSTWPHILFNTYFGISDTLRFDEQHQSWYRERF